MAQFFISVVADKKIMLVANTAWNLWNYRSALIRALANRGFEVVLAAPDDRFRDALLQISGVRFIALQHLSRKSLSPLQNLRLLLELYRHFRREKPAVILLYTIKPNTLGNFAAAFAGIKTVSILEGLGYSGSAGARWRWVAALLYRLALRTTQRVVFLNAADCREFLDNHLVQPAKALVIHGPGIDLTHFSPRTKHRHDDRPVFLFSGRLLAEKGIREFAAAARMLNQGGAKAVFRVLGAPDPGNPSSINIKEVEDWANAGFLQYYGSTDDVRPFLAEADVLVLPSYYREGVPRSVLEAMAMGKIIITTDTPGCRDTVEAGRNGLLVPARDTGALLDAIRQVLGLSAENYAAMSARSIEKVRTEFSDEVVLPQYMRLIESV